MVQRKVVNPNDFYDLDAITERLANFEVRYNTTAQPFDWTFTKGDLNDLLKRIATHEPTLPPRWRWPPDLAGRFPPPGLTGGHVQPAGAVECLLG